MASSRPRRRFPWLSRSCHVFFAIDCHPVIETGLEYVNTAQCQLLVSWRPFAGEQLTEAAPVSPLRGEDHSYFIPVKMDRTHE